MPTASFLAVETNDSPVIVKIKEKSNACGGKKKILLLMGEQCEIWFDANGKGLVSPKIPPANQLLWESFDATVEVVMKNGGKAKKGNAQSGGGSTNSRNLGWKGSGTGECPGTIFEN